MARMDYACASRSPNGVSRPKAGARDISVGIYRDNWGRLALITDRDSGICQESGQLSSPTRVMRRGRLAAENVPALHRVGEQLAARPQNRNVGCSHGLQAFGRGGLGGTGKTAPPRPRRSPSSSGSVVLAGVVLAGIALPAAGALGLSAKGTATGFDDLPGELKRPPLSQALAHPRLQRRPDRDRLLPRPHGRAAHPDHPGHAEGHRRHRGLALLRARRDRPQGHRCARSPATPRTAASRRAPRPSPSST